MAGRPIDPQFRAQRKEEINDVIQSLKSRRLAVTRKTIAEEMGISVQAFYSGYLREYIEELESNGTIPSAKVAPPQFSADEVKALLKANKKFRVENERLQKKNAILTENLKEKDQEITALTEKIKQLKGELFQKQKYEFAQNRI